jgi:hypothetical protein
MHHSAQFGSRCQPAAATAAPRVIEASRRRGVEAVEAVEAVEVAADRDGSVAGSTA